MLSVQYFNENKVGLFVDNGCVITFIFILILKVKQSVRA